MCPASLRWVPWPGTTLCASSKEEPLQLPAMFTRQGDPRIQISIYLSTNWSVPSNIMISICHQYEVAHIFMEQHFSRDNSCVIESEWAWWDNKALTLFPRLDFSFFPVYFKWVQEEVSLLHRNTWGWLWPGLPFCTICNLTQPHIFSNCTHISTVREWILNHIFEHGKPGTSPRVNNSENGQPAFSSSLILFYSCFSKSTVWFGFLRKSLRLSSLVNFLLVKQIVARPSWLQPKDLHM